MSTEVIWRGCLYVKSRRQRELFACTADMTAFMSIHRPSTLGGSLKLSHKTNLSDGMKKFLYEIPYLARDTENYWHGFYYNCCLLTPRTQEGKFSNVVKYLDDRQLIGLVRLPEGGVMLMTDSKLTQHLGLPSIDGVGLHCITVSNISCLREPGSVNELMRQGPEPAPLWRGPPQTRLPLVLYHLPDVFPESLGGDWKTMLTIGTDLTAKQRFPNAFTPVKSECDAATANPEESSSGNGEDSSTDLDISLPWMSSIAGLKLESVDKSPENSGASSPAETGVPLSSFIVKTETKTETGNNDPPELGRGLHGATQLMKIEQQTELGCSPNAGRLKKVTVLLKDLETEMNQYQRMHGKVIANVSTCSSPATGSVAMSDNASVGTDDCMETEQTLSVMGDQPPEANSPSVIQDTKKHRSSNREAAFSPRRKPAREGNESNTTRKKEKKAKDHKAGHSSKYERKKQKHSSEPNSVLDKKSRLKSWVHANKYKDAKPVLAELDLGLQTGVVKSLGRIPKKNQQASTSSSPLCDGSRASVTSSAKSSPGVTQYAAPNVSKHGDAPENISDDDDDDDDGAALCEDSRAVEPSFVSEMGDTEIAMHELIGDNIDSDEDDRKMKLFESVMLDEPRDCIPGFGDWDKGSAAVTRAVVKSVEKGLLISLLASDGKSVCDSLLVGKNTVEDAVASILHGDTMDTSVPLEDNLTIYVNQVLHHPIPGATTKRSLYFVVENKIKKMVVNLYDLSISSDMKYRAENEKVLHTDEVTAKLLSIVSGEKSGHWKYGPASKDRAETRTEKIHDGGGITQVDEPVAVDTIKKEIDDILDTKSISEDKTDSDKMVKDVVKSEIKSPRTPDGHANVHADVPALPEKCVPMSNEKQTSKDCHRSETVRSDSITSKIKSTPSSKPVSPHSSEARTSNLISKGDSRIVLSSGEKSAHVSDLRSDRITSKEPSMKQEKESRVSPGGRPDKSISSEKSRHSSTTEKNRTERTGATTESKRNSSDGKTKHSSGSKEKETIVSKDKSRRSSETVKLERSSRETSRSSGRDNSERSPSRDSSRHASREKSRHSSGADRKSGEKTDTRRSDRDSEGKVKHTGGSAKTNISPSSDRHSRSSSGRDKSGQSPSKEKVKLSSQTKKQSQSSRTDNNAKPDASADTSSKDIASRLGKLAATKVSRSEHRQSRQYHPYRKETRHSHYKPSWSFDIAYRDMDELLQNLTENTFKQKGRKPAPDTSWKRHSGYRRNSRFRRYEFKRSDVPRTLPKWIEHSDPEEETDEISPDNIPDREARMRKADMVEVLITMQEDKEDLTPEANAYTEETGEADRRVVIATCTKLEAGRSLSVSPVDHGPVSPGVQTTKSHEDDDSVSIVDSVPVSPDPVPVSPDQAQVSPGDRISVSPVTNDGTSAELSSACDTSVDRCNDRSGEIEKKLETYIHSVKEAISVRKPMPGAENVNVFTKGKSDTDVIVKLETEDDEDNLQNKGNDTNIEKKLETYLHSVREAITVRKPMPGAEQVNVNNKGKLGPDVVVKLEIEEDEDNLQNIGNNTNIEKKLEKYIHSVKEEITVRKTMSATACSDNEIIKVNDEMKIDPDVIEMELKEDAGSPKRKVYDMNIEIGKKFDTYIHFVQEEVIIMKPTCETLSHEKEQDKICDKLEIGCESNSDVDTHPESVDKLHSSTNRELKASSIFEERKFNSTVSKNIFSSESDICLDWTDDEVDKSKDESSDSDGNMTFIVVDTADSSDAEKTIQTDTDHSDIETNCTLGPKQIANLEHVAEDADKNADSDLDLTTVECTEEVVDSHCEENESGGSKLYITLDEYKDDEISLAVDTDQTLLAADNVHTHSSPPKESFENYDSVPEQSCNNLCETQTCPELNKELVEKEGKSLKTELDEKLVLTSTGLCQRPEGNVEEIYFSNVSGDENNQTRKNMSKNDFKNDLDQIIWSRGINCSSSLTSVVYDSVSSKREVIENIVDESAVQNEYVQHTPDTARRIQQTLKLRHDEKTNRTSDLFVGEQIEVMENSNDSKPMALKRENTNETVHEGGIEIAHELNVSSEEIVASSTCLEDGGCQHVAKLVDGDSITDNIIPQTKICIINELSSIEVIPSSCAEDTSDMDSDEEFPALRDCITLSTAVDHEDKIEGSLQRSYQSLNDKIDPAKRTEVVESSEDENETVIELSSDDASENGSSVSDRKCNFVTGESSNRTFQQYQKHLSECSENTHTEKLSYENIGEIGVNSAAPHSMGQKVNLNKDCHKQISIEQEQIFKKGNSEALDCENFLKKKCCTSIEKAASFEKSVYTDTGKSGCLEGSDTLKLIENVEIQQLEIQLPQVSSNGSMDFEKNNRGEFSLKDRVEKITEESNLPKHQPEEGDLTNKCHNIGTDKFINGANNDKSEISIQNKSAKQLQRPASSQDATSLMDGEEFERNKICFMNNDTETPNKCNETEDETKKICSSAKAGQEPMHLQVMVNGNHIKLTDYEELPLAAKHQHNSVVCGTEESTNECTNYNDSEQQNRCSVLDERLEKEPCDHQKEYCTNGGVSNEISETQDSNNDYGAQENDSLIGSADIIWNGKVMTQAEYETLFSTADNKYCGETTRFSVENKLSKDGESTQQNDDHIDETQMDCKVIETQEMVEISSAEKTSYTNIQIGFDEEGTENPSPVDLPKQVSVCIVGNDKNLRPADDKTCFVTATNHSNSGSVLVNASTNAFKLNDQANEKILGNKIVEIEKGRLLNDAKTNFVTSAVPNTALITESGSLLKGKLPLSPINGLGLLYTAYADECVAANTVDKFRPSPSVTESNAERVHCCPEGKGYGAEFPVSESIIKHSGAVELIGDKANKADIQEENNGNSAEFGLTNSYTLEKGAQLNSLQLLCNEYDDDTDMKVCTDDKAFSDISDTEVDYDYLKERHTKSQIQAEVKSDVLAVDKNDFECIPLKVESSIHVASKEFLAKADSEDRNHTLSTEDGNDKDTTKEAEETILDISDESDDGVKDDHILSVAASNATSAYTLEKIAQLNSLQLLGKEYDNSSAMDLVRAYSPDEHDDEESATESDLCSKNNSEQNVLVADDCSKEESINRCGNEEFNTEHGDKKNIGQTKELKDFGTNGFTDDAEIAFDEMYSKSKWQNLSSSSESLLSDLKEMADSHGTDNKCCVSGNISSGTMEGNSTDATLMSSFTAEPDVSEIPYQGTEDFMERDACNSSDASSDISVQRLNEKNSKQGIKYDNMSIYQTECKEKTSPKSFKEKKERSDFEETQFISPSSSRSILSQLSSCSVAQLLQRRSKLQQLLDESTTSDTSCSDTVDEKNSTPERYIQNLSSVRKTALSSSVGSRKTSCSGYSSSCNERDALNSFGKNIGNRDSSRNPLEKEVANEKISLRDIKSRQKVRGSDDENKSGVFDANSYRSKKTASGIVLPDGDEKYKYTLQWLNSVPKSNNDLHIPLKSGKSFKRNRPNHSSKNYASLKQPPNKPDGYLLSSSSVSHSSKPKYDQRKLNKVTDKSVTKNSCMKEKSTTDTQSSSDDYQQSYRYGSEKLELMKLLYKNNTGHTAASHFLRQSQSYDSDLDCSLSSPISKKSMSSSFSFEGTVTSRRALSRNDGHQAVTTDHRRSSKATDSHSVVFLHPSTLRTASTVDMMHLVKAMGRCSDRRHSWILALLSSQWRSLEKEKKMMKQEKLCYNDTVQLVPDQEGSFTSIETLAKQTLRGDPAVKKVYIINESHLDHRRDRTGLVQCSLAEFLDFHLAAV